MRFLRKVLHGEKLGRKLGFPTLNFHIGNFGKDHSVGVYQCTVWIKDPQKVKKHNAYRLPPTAYQGALYFGPKGSGKTVLEIHVLNFSQDVYSQFVSFEVGQKIREPIKFDSFDALQAQIEEDVKKVAGELI